MEKVEPEMEVEMGLARKRLLWVEDDPPERFIHEQRVLEEEDDIEVSWARSVASAAQILCEDVYHALVLDQMLPMAEGESVTIWGGCCLLHWLRGNTEEFSATANDERPALPRGNPLDDNREVPVIIVSAFVDDEVLETTKKASNHDSVIARILKPLDKVRLRAWLERAMSTGQEK